jgi:hypothetical protein
LRELNTSAIGFWDNEANQRQWLGLAAQKLSINQLSDWYRVKNEDIIQLGGLFQAYRLIKWEIFKEAQIFCVCKQQELL